MGWRDWFRGKPADPVERAARQAVRQVVRWQRRHPGARLQSLLEGRLARILATLVPEGSPQREQLDRILAPGNATDDVAEFCRRLVSFQAGIGEDDAAGNEKVRAAVARAMERAGFASGSR